MITIYKITHGSNIHTFTVEADALSYIQANPEAVLTTEEIEIPEVDLNAQIESFYMNASWQLFLDLLEAHGISHPLLTHEAAHIQIAAWNLYNNILRLKNWSIYQRPLIQEYRTFNFLFNQLIYHLPINQISDILDLTKECNITLLNIQELVNNLKALNKLSPSYQY